jgi:hypothetical protein
MNKLSTYLKENGYIQAKVVNGPNGDFIVAAKEDNSIATFPVGKNSQGENDIFAFNYVIGTRDGIQQVIATVNQYSETEFQAL